MMAKYYDWDATFSRQTGSQGEFCIVAGGKNIGKTFGLKKKCIEEFIKKGFRFVNISRFKDEREQVEIGYFEKLQHDGFFKDYVFDIKKHVGYIAKKPENPEEKPEFEPICYFVALSAFQVEKQRSFVNMHRFIFDEAAIDRRDKYHDYLPQEFFILANLLDSVNREQYGDAPFFKVYLLMNACDLTCPYLRMLGIDKPPKYGYTFYNGKSTLFHYVEPWDVEERRASTLVGRMLAGSDESRMVFDNEFDTGNDADIEKKSSVSRFGFGIVFSGAKFGVWFDYNDGFVYVNEQIPNGAKNVYTLTKKDNSIDYQAIRRTDDILRSLIEIYYAGMLRYSSVAVREGFLQVLGFLGIK